MRRRRHAGEVVGHCWQAVWWRLALARAGWHSIKTACDGAEALNTRTRLRPGVCGFAGWHPFTCPRCKQAQSAKHNVHESPYPVGTPALWIGLGWGLSTGRGVKQCSSMSRARVNVCINQPASRMATTSDAAVWSAIIIFVGARACARVCVCVCVCVCVSVCRRRVCYKSCFVAVETV